MVSSIGYFTRGLYVEQRKAQHTLVFWLALAVPLLIASLDFCIYYYRGSELLQYRHEQTPWHHFTFHLLVMWSMLMLPMYICLQSALVTVLEHQANAWKHIYSLPIPKWSIYASKLFFFVGLFLVSSLALIVFAEVAGWLLRWLKPAFGIDPLTDHWMLIRNVLKTFLIGLGITAIQFYLSFRYRNFIISAAFGTFLFLTGIIVKSWSYSYVLPYLWPYFSIRDHAYQTDWINEYVWAGVLTFIIVAIGGFGATYRRDVN